MPTEVETVDELSSRDGPDIPGVLAGLRPKGPSAERSKSERPAGKSLQRQPRDGRYRATSGSVLDSGAEFQRRTARETVNRDAAGALAYQKTFQFGIEEGRLERSLKASAGLLSGKYFTGLLISYRLKLSTGEDAEAWQVFGYQDGTYKPQDARFRVFDKPMRGEYGANTSAEMQLVTPNGTVTKPMVTEGEIFEFRVWTGYFYLFLPVGVDFAHGKLTPGRRCAGTGGAEPGMHEIGCDMRVEAERKPLDAETTFLRLFPGEPGRLDQGEARHLVLDKNSKVEILKGRAFVDWGLSGDLMQVAFRDLCLEVRIDGDEQKTGWIQSDEDFAAVGLPSRSSEP
jgi:hypothetical protein